MKNTFQIIEINFGTPEFDQEYSFEIDQFKFNCQRISTLGSVSYTKKLIDQYSSEVDSIALTSLPYATKIRQKNYTHRNYLEIMNHPSPISLNDGREIKSLLNFESIHELTRHKIITSDQTILFPFSMSDMELTDFIKSKFKMGILIGDLLESFSLPFFWKVKEDHFAFQKTALFLSNVFQLKDKIDHIDLVKKLHKLNLNNYLNDYEVVFGDLDQLINLCRKNNLVKDKIILSSNQNEILEKEILALGAQSIHHLIPQRFRFSKNMNYPVLEAALRLIHEKDHRLTFTDWENILSTPSQLKHTFREFSIAQSDSLQKKTTFQVKKIYKKISSKKKYDFAFIIHALSHKDFEKVPGLGSIVRKIPKSFNHKFDQLIGKAPGISFGEITHIRSEYDNREVNGVLYALLTTPKVLKESNPEDIYKKIESICFQASDQGAKIIGLGAYTKVIGDSGLTISRNSPIPVTTGNSLSAAATLWALREVIDKMKLVLFDPTTQKYRATGMVIGATGAIGKTSAKLMALKCAKLILVAPNIQKLQQVKTEILELTKDCEIIISTNANFHAHEVDALVTATSAVDSTIVDIMKLKSGCVVCDCSRPLDFSAEQAQKRPDVLIIESGEVDLPGPINMNCDIGLPHNSVYACLAETALLALEEKYESFTLGREIPIEKVIEIYRLAQKHGLKLSKIQSHFGAITDKEIQIVRELALKNQLKT